MLRGNLSTRPFYNERAVQALLGGLAVVLVLLSLFTVWRFVALTGQQRELSARIARDESRAGALRREAVQVRSRVDARLLESTVKATREANAVIDERTFSWTALFNVFERTIPSEVRLRAVTPSNDRGVFLVRFTVNTPRVEPVGLFLDRLEAAGAFVGVRSVEEQGLEDGTFNVVCEGQYLGPGTEKPAAVGTDPIAPASPPAAAARAGGN
jgi:hypothetical protein